MILFDCLGDGFFERVEMHASGLLHDLADAVLADLESFQSLGLREKLFAADADPSSFEVNLSQSLTTTWIVNNVYIVQDLHLV